MKGDKANCRLGLDEFIFFYRRAPEAIVIEEFDV